MYKAMYLSPMVPSYDLEATGSFLREVLRFEPVMTSNTYAVYQKENVTIHLLRAGDDIGQMEFYLEVDDLEALWAFMKDKVEGLRMKGPMDRDYGMREVHIEVPATNALLFIGQAL